MALVPVGVWASLNWLFFCLASVLPGDLIWAADQPQLLPAALGCPSPHTESPPAYASSSHLPMPHPPPAPLLPPAALSSGSPTASASHREENAALAPLAVATLRALLLFPPDAFRSHLKDFFPLLTALISCEYAPPEVQRALSELFAKRIGPMLGSA